MTELLLQPPAPVEKELWAKSSGSCRSAAKKAQLLKEEWLKSGCDGDSSSCNDNEDSGFGELELSSTSTTATTTSTGATDAGDADPLFQWGQHLASSSSSQGEDEEDVFLDSLVQQDRQHRRPLRVSDAVEPEESVQSMISADDFCKFVLFKTHYKRFMNLSQLYNEALETTCYLEDKYDDLQKAYGNLESLQRALETRLAAKEAELSRRDDELFDAMERLARLEDEGDQLKHDKRRAERQSAVLESEKVTYENQVASMKFERDHYATSCDTLKRMVKSAKVECDKLHHKSQVVQLEVQEASLKVSLQMSELEFAVQQISIISAWLRKGLQHLAACTQRRCRICCWLRKNFTTFPAARDQKNCVRRLFTGIREDLNKLRQWLRPMPLMAPLRERPATPSPQRPRRSSSIRRPSLSLAMALNPLDLGSGAPLALPERDSDSSVTPPQDEELPQRRPVATSSPHVPLGTQPSLSHDSGYYSYVPDTPRANGTCNGEADARVGRKINRGTNTLDRPAPRATEDSEDSEEDDSKLNRQNSWRASFRKLFHRVSKR